MKKYFGKENEKNIEIEKLSRTKIEKLNALKLCNEFIVSSLFEAAYGESYSLFGRMTGASEKLPENFEDIEEKSSLQGSDRRVQPYIRSQLFIALIAEIETYFFDLLKIVLEDNITDNDEIEKK